MYVIKRIILMVVTFMIIMQVIPQNVNAGTKLEKNKTYYYTFATAGGGINTAVVKVDYTEYVVNHKGKNKYWKRDIFYAFRTIYSDCIPKLSMYLSLTQHVDKDGKTLHKFKKWMKQSVLADNDYWDYYGFYKNGTNEYYKKTTKNKGVTTFLVDCEDAINGRTRGDLVKLKLNTK